MNGNLEKLEAGGVIIKTPIPQAFAEVLESLSEGEIDVIVSVKRRLDEAGVSHGLVPAETFLNFIVI